MKRSERKALASELETMLQWCISARRAWKLRQRVLSPAGDARRHIRTRSLEVAVDGGSPREGWRA